MELTVLGCSGSVSGPTSPASAYLVQAPYEGRTFSLLLDLGPGAFGALWSHLGESGVDAIGLSHLHPDHCLDLCAYYVAAKYGGARARPPVPLFGPTDTMARLTRAYQVGAEPAALNEVFAFRNWAAEQTVGPFTLRSAAVDHPVEAYAVRVTEQETGRSLVYSGDTGPCPALADLARGADLLLVEAAFVESPENPPSMHLTGRQAAEAAHSANVGRMLLTHIPPWRDPNQILSEARPHFDGPVELAAAGLRQRIG